MKTSGPRNNDARREPFEETLHGLRISDPYRWLEEGDHPEADAQNHAAREYLHALPERQQLATRLEEVLYYGALGLPVHRGHRIFWGRKARDREKSVVLWREEQGPERVLLDPNSVALGGYWPSWDGKLVAYSRKENNSDESITYLMDVVSGVALPDVIPGTKYSGASSWAAG